MSITGLPGQGPVRVGIAISDSTAGLYLSFGIVLALLNREAARAVHSPDVRDRLAVEGGEPVGNSPTEFAAYVKREINRWSTIVKATGMKAG